MSQCLVPNWNNVRQQRQEDDDHEEAPEEKKRSSHANKLHPNPPMLMPSQQRVSELKWANGHLINTQEPDEAPFLDQKASTLLWPGTGDTLESVVHQSSQYKRNIDSSDLGLDYYNIQHNLPNNVMDSVVASSDIGGKWLPKPSCKGPTDSDPTHKRPRQDPSPAQTRQYYCSHALHAGKPAISYATASFESPQSFRTKITDDDSACQGNPDDEGDDKTETMRSHSTRRSRAAAVHNQSERRRRERINQKMETLQKLLPNASKIDKASVLDEVIEYMKQLQVQLQMMSSRTMSQMLIPMGIQHLQMPNIMARMGMGMIDSMAAPPPIPPLLHPTAAAGPSTFVTPFMLPNLIPQLPQTQAKSVPHRHPMPLLSDPYSAYLAQTMNMELYSKMAAFYRQQAGDQMGKGTAASREHSDSSV